MSSNDKDGNLRDATRDFKRKILCGDIKEEKLIGLILHDRGERGVIILRGFNFYMTGLTVGQNRKVRIEGDDVLFLILCGWNDEKEEKNQQVAGPMG